MFRFFHYWKWKRMARKAIEEKRTTKCVECSDSIIPGDFVAICTLVGEKEEKIIHAGFHLTLEKPDAFCETAGVGIGVWDGEHVVGSGKSLVAKCFETGKVQRL